MTHPHLGMLLAQARVEELRRTAAARRHVQHPSQPHHPAAAGGRVMLRLITPADEPSLARLAALDSSEPPGRPILLAGVDGELLAAMSVADGAVVATPFRATAAVIELLHARATPASGRQPQAPFAAVAIMAPSACRWRSLTVAVARRAVR
jgi:hypothetical protein